MRNGIIIMAVGDIIAGDHPHFVGVGVGKAVKDGSYMFEHVEKIFANADIVFGNLETPLSNYGETGSYESLVLRGSPDFVKQLKQAHFNVINIANNHIQQHSERAFWDTVHLLEQYGILTVGLKPRIIEVKGKQLAILGYSLRPEEHADEILYAHADKGEIIAECIRLRKEADYMILSLHWGEEYVDIPSAEQVDFAHELIDRGVNVLIGHHPHVVQPVERYKGGIIAYSLGNFVSDMCSRVCKNSIILKMILCDSGRIETELVPIRIGDHYQPKILYGSEREKIIREVMSPVKIVNSGKYSTLVKRCLRRNRCEYALFLLTHFYKFPLKALLYIVYSAIKRRI